jgi:hypothetical protein
MERTCSAYDRMKAIIDAPTVSAVAGIEARVVTALSAAHKFCKTTLTTTRDAKATWKLLEHHQQGNEQTYNLQIFEETRMNSWRFRDEIVDSGGSNEEESADWDDCEEYLLKEKRKIKTPTTMLSMRTEGVVNERAGRIRQRRSHLGQLSAGL